MEDGQQSNDEREGEIGSLAGDLKIIPSPRNSSSSGAARPQALIRNEGAAGAAVTRGRARVFSFSREGEGVGRGVNSGGGMRSIPVALV